MNVDDEKDDAEITQTMANSSDVVSAFRKKKAAEAKLEEFERLKLVGKGTFGKVFKVKHRTTGKIYAMKTIRKDTVLDNQSLDSLKLEMEVLEKVDHQFLVNMDYVFTDKYRVFFMMDYIDGGELFRHLMKIKRFKEKEGAFIIAQVALALGHLHE